MRIFRFVSGLLATVCVLSGTSTVAQRSDLPRVTPSSVGVSAERLQKLDELMQGMVDKKEFAGIVTMAARKGEIFHSKAYGMRDIASGSPMTEDTIFRIFSMTKPVTAVAMMILYEEGKWKPEDPIAKHIPEFAGLKVFKEVDAAGKIVVEDLARPPTMHELMTHTAGFSYGFENDDLGKLHRDETGRNAIFASSSFKEMIDRVAKIPLRYQPGTRWHYGMSVDLQGYIVEKLSGKPLAVFMKERIFDPLGMKDTAFYVPKEKQNRFATYHWKEKTGELIPKRPSPNDRDYTVPPAVPTGGGGLVSKKDGVRHAILAEMPMNTAFYAKSDNVRSLKCGGFTLPESNNAVLCTRAIMRRLEPIVQCTKALVRRYIELVHRCNAFVQR